MSITPNPRCVHTDCFANKCGECTVLTNTAFNKDCPFFRTREEQLQDKLAAAKKLMELERIDLIEAYWKDMNCLQKILAHDSAQLEALRAR